MNWSCIIQVLACYAHCGAANIIDENTKVSKAVFYLCHNINPTGSKRIAHPRCRLTAVLWNNVDVGCGWSHRDTQYPHNNTISAQTERDWYDQNDVHQGHLSSNTFFRWFIFTYINSPQGAANKIPITQTIISVLFRISLGTPVSDCVIPMRIYKKSLEALKVRYGLHWAHAP